MTVAVQMCEQGKRDFVHCFSDPVHTSMMLAVDVHCSSSCSLVCTTFWIWRHGTAHNWLCCAIGVTIIPIQGSGVGWISDNIVPVQVSKVFHWKWLLTWLSEQIVNISVPSNVKTNFSPPVLDSITTKHTAVLAMDFTSINFLYDCHCDGQWRSVCLFSFASLQTLHCQSCWKL